MTTFKSHILIVLIFGLTVTRVYAQIINATETQEIEVKKGAIIEVNSKYTNIEIELTDENKVTVQAIMDIEGLSKEEVGNYFKKWDFKATKKNNTVNINSILKSEMSASMSNRGYYEGFFINKEDLGLIQLDINEKTNKKLNYEGKNKTSVTVIDEKNYMFSYEKYIEDGDDYLKEWKKETGNGTASRWKNNTRQERIALVTEMMTNNRKLNVNKKEEVSTKPPLKAKPEIKALPRVNVRSFPKRAIVNKTLKIKIPKDVQLHIEARHGKITFKNYITNLKANLSHVLLEAKTIRGNETSIKGNYSNFVFDKWEGGELEVNFSGHTLINYVEDMVIKSNSSGVHIGEVAKNFDAKGHFKGLTLSILPTIQQFNLDIEDSKRVRMALPKNGYNLNYVGIDTELDYSERFSLQTISRNPKKQSITYNDNNNRTITIKALSCGITLWAPNLKN